MQYFSGRNQNISVSNSSISSKCDKWAPSTVLQATFPTATYIIFLYVNRYFYSIQFLVTIRYIQWWYRIKNQAPLVNSLMFIFQSFIWTSSTDGTLKRWPFKYLWLPKDVHRDKMTNLKKENRNWITSFIICCTQHTLQVLCFLICFRLFLTLVHVTDTEGLVCFLIDKQVAHACVSLNLKEKSRPRIRWWNRPNMNL